MNYKHKHERGRVQVLLKQLSYLLNSALCSGFNSPHINILLSPHPCIPVSLPPSSTFLRTDVPGTPLCSYPCSSVLAVSASALPFPHMRPPCHCFQIPTPPPHPVSVTSPWHRRLLPPLSRLSPHSSTPLFKVPCPTHTHPILAPLHSYGCVSVPASVSGVQTGICACCTNGRPSSACSAHRRGRAWISQCSLQCRVTRYRVWINAAAYHATQDAA